MKDHPETMKYAVVQSELVKPTPEALKAAFRAVEEFVDIDATAFSNDAYGIITNGLDMDNFALLVQDVTTFASAAILNRGAESLRHDNTVTFHYPTRHAFEEETVWLLWSAMQSRRSQQTGQSEACEP